MGFSVRIVPPDLKKLDQKTTNNKIQQNDIESSSYWFIKISLARLIKCSLPSGDCWKVGGWSCQGWCGKSIGFPFFVWFLHLQWNISSKRLPLDPLWAIWVGPITWQHRQHSAHMTWGEVGGILPCLLQAKDLPHAATTMFCLSEQLDVP